MAIAFRAAGTPATGTTALSVVIPATAQVGDVLILSVNGCTSTAVSGAVTATGWTRQDYTSDFSSTTPFPTLTVLWRTCIAGDPGATVVCSFANAPTTCVGVINAYSGVGTAGPFEIHGVWPENSSAGTTAHTFPPITTAIAGDWLFTACGDRSGSTWTAPTTPVAFSERSDTATGAAANLETADSNATVTAGTYSTVSASSSTTNTSVGVFFIGALVAAPTSVPTPRQTAQLSPTTVASTTGTTWATTTNATGTTRSTFATWTNATSGGTGNIQLSGYAAQAFIADSGATVKSVSALVAVNESSTTNIPTATIQLYSGTTAIGSPTTIPVSATTTYDATLVFTGANCPTYAQCADLRAQVNFTHAANTTSAVGNVDVVLLTVSYLSSSGIAIDASSPARVNGASTNGTTAITTAAFNPPACVLVATFQCNARTAGGGNGIVNSITMTSNVAGLTWTTANIRGLQDSGGLSGCAAILIAPLSAAQTGMTLTATANANVANDINTPSLKVYCVTGANMTTPLGGTTEGSSSATTAITTTGFTTVGAASMGFFSACDWNALGAFTSSDCVVDTFANTGVSVSTASGYKALGATGSSATFNIDPFGTAAPAVNWVTAEVIPGPTFVASSTATVNGTTTLSVPVPTGLTTGDVMLIAGTTFCGTGGPSVPAGYTLIRSGTGTVSTSHNYFVYYKIAGASETATTVTFPANSWGQAIGYALRGVPTTIANSYLNLASAYSTTAPPASGALASTSDAAIYIYTGINSAATGTNGETSPTGLSNVTNLEQSTEGGFTTIGWGVNATAPSSITTTTAVDYMNVLIDLGTAAALTTRITANSVAATTTNNTVATMTAAIPIGTLVMVSYCSWGFGGSAPVVTIADSKSNTWVNHVSVENGTVGVIQHWSCVLTTALAISDTITVNSVGTTGLNDYGLTVDYVSGYTNIGAEIGALTNGTSTTPSVSLTPASSASSALVYGALTTMTTAPTITEDADSTGGDTWHSATKLITTTSGKIVQVAGAFKAVAPAATAQTYNPTLNASQLWEAYLVSYPVSTGGPAFIAEANPSVISQAISRAAFF